MTTRRAGRPLTLRLVLAFIGVAVLGVLLATVLTLLMAGSDISDLEQQQQQGLVDSLAAVAAASYNTGTPGWSDVDLRPAMAVASTAGTEMTVLDQTGNVVASTRTGPGAASDVVTRPIAVDGRQVGTLQVQFTSRGLLAPIDELRTAVTEAVVGAAGVAALGALVVALLVARRITAPAASLIGWSRAVSAGERNVRVGELPHAPAELVELAANLDAMADSLAEQEELRREQAADIAHELRRPIAVLRATCEAMTDGLLPLDQRHAASLLDNVLHLEGIVDDVRDIAALEPAPWPGMQACDLAAIAESVATAWEASFAAARVAFERHLVAAPVRADPRRLRQAIANLVSNALKFTPAEGRVRMELVVLDGQARLMVSDTGPGVSDADQAHLYERRWRGDGSVGTQGQGIGLAVTSALVRAQDGRIEVASSPDNGSTFTVVLPLAQQDART